MKQSFLFLILFSLLLASVSCSEKRTAPPVLEKETVLYPSWVDNAVIYEVNIRQYTPEGTFRAFKDHLPRIKELGVDILWLMPIHPIGELKRKGSLGSYYSVKEYKFVNPEFGNMDDFYELIQAIHDNGMYVIMDWVANHTSWDNRLVIYPDYYTRDAEGNIISPVEDWSDVADLNYNNYEMRQYMMDVMGFWVKEYNIDGFRCDVADMVPQDFWVKLRHHLNEIKPVFMLAEANNPDLLSFSFDMDYDWEFHHLMNELVNGGRIADEINHHFMNNTMNYPRKAIRMNFTSNHDENSWNGSAVERLGDALPVMTVLTALVPGMPLVYGGQEAGLDKRLRFFDKDTIEWKDHEMSDLFKKTFAIKKENKALWNGQEGGSYTPIAATEQEKILAFAREVDGNLIIGLFNLSSEACEFEFNCENFQGRYTDLFTGEKVRLKEKYTSTLPAWGYQVLGMNY